jgi:hypothetical protein
MREGADDGYRELLVRIGQARAACVHYGCKHEGQHAPKSGERIESGPKNES